MQQEKKKEKVWKPTGTEARNSYGIIIVPVGPGLTEVLRGMELGQILAFKTSVFPYNSFKATASRLYKEEGLVISSKTMPCGKWIHVSYHGIDVNHKTKDDNKE